ncbi:flagellar filament capping protein FliD [Sphingomonas bacterium]|uniref:flagellar filament capping protein FliD n=1 Tax=Sphingomonas bacterium TaxID=1895847 RepID=UPI0020C676F6|nr:flagellar filament capping protein FliD [Sphingomonas bacterium]
MTTTASTATSSATSSTSILTTLGVGSGIDSAALVTKLVAASFDPKDQALATRETANSAKISTLAALSSDIDSFASSLSTLISGGSLRTQPTTSDAGVLTATAQSGAQLGGLSAQLIVKQLAKAQSLVSNHYPSGATAVGSGGLTLTTGKGTFTVTLDSGNNTVAGIAAAINAAGAGVTASVVTDAGGARLSIKGATGAANAFTIAPTAGSDSALDSLAWPQGNGVGLTQAQAAQDAIVNLDGVDVDRASNTIDDLVAGVTLTLVKEAPAETVSLGATRPIAAISQAVGDFVTAFNALKSELATATAAATGGTGAGPFSGDSGIRSIRTQLSRLTSTVLNSAGSPSTLAEIGVSTNRDGTLSLDSAALSKALTNYPDGVEALFNPTQHASSPLIRITSAMGAAKAGTYALANIVPANGNTPASGSIAGLSGQATGNSLAASSVSSAAGLVIEASGSIAGATVTVDPGIGGALQAIRDQLRRSGGLLDAISTTLTSQKTSLADQRTRLTSSESSYKDRLTSQFSTMDARVASYKATQSYLTQQIAIWTNKS